MPEMDARFYIAELAAALNSLHEAGIVYRDLKPENVLIAASGHIKLTDFGFACTLDYGEKLNSFCGSPYYIAPEMLVAIAYDSVVDWWALGILAYELLVGQPPFIGKTPREVYRAILVGDIDWAPLKSHSEAQQLIKGLLRNDPLKRFRYAEIKSSQWFAGNDWRQVESRSLEPPFVVNATSPFDASYFVKYRKDEARFGPSVTMRESVHVPEFSLSS
jgi:serine/threonine protein kinase